MTSPELPIVYHNNGSGYRKLENRGTAFFEVLVAGHFRGEAKSSEPEDLEIVLCHNYPDPPLTQRSLDHLGFRRYTVLGQALRPWTNIAKIGLISEHLRHRCRAEYVVCLDAADVIVVDDLQTLRDRFLSEFDCDVVFNAEKTSSPGSKDLRVPVAKRLRVPGRKKPYVPWAPGEYEKVVRIEDFEVAHYRAPFRHLNSGCLIGRREAVIDVYAEAATLTEFITSGHYDDDDQVIMREVHRRLYPRVRIDDECRLFQCMFMIDRDEIRSRFPLGGAGARLHYLREGARRNLKRGFKAVGTLFE